MIAENPSISEIAARAHQSFNELYQSTPTITAVAPGRVNLIGEHVDYCDGIVLPLAISRYVVISARPNDSKIAHITGPGLDPVKFDISAPQITSDKKWANYLGGVTQGFLDLNYHIPGFDAYIESTLPLGAGLSSSTALECCFATLIEGLVDTVLPTHEKTRIALESERKHSNAPSGISDQFASAYGAEDHLILIDCQSREADLIPFNDPTLSFLIVDTCVSHDLGDELYLERFGSAFRALHLLDKPSWRDVTMDDVYQNEEKLGETLYRRAKHIVTETQRAPLAANVLTNGDFASIGKIMADSHRSLRDDFQVSCDELDLIVGLANEIGFEGGVLGARMTGSGFGGSALILCRTDQLEEIAKKINRAYEAETGIIPIIFSTRPSKGAHILS